MARKLTIQMQGNQCISGISIVNYSSVSNQSVWLLVELVKITSKPFLVCVRKTIFKTTFLERYLKDIELFAPERTCSGTTLKAFPRATAGMVGAFVSGYVS